MALELIPPIFLPVLLLVGIGVIWFFLKAVEKFAFIILLVTIEIGMAFLMYSYYLPEIISIEGLSLWRLYPPIFWDKVIGALATTTADPSLMATALICLGLLYVYFVKILKKQGLLAPIFAGIILIISGLTLPGFRTFLNVMNVAWLFYGVTILATAGIIGWKALSKKK